MSRKRVLLICLSLFIWSQIQASTIVLKSKGEVEVKPDMARMHVQISCIDYNIETARNCLLEKTNELKRLLDWHKINENDVQTSQITLNKEHRWEKNVNIFKGYRASTGFWITARNLDQLEKMYPKLLVEETFTIGSLSFDHSRRDSLVHQAYLAALKDADILSDKMLDQLSFKSKRVVYISNVQPPQKESPIQRMKSLEFNESVDHSLPIEAGNIKIVSELFVEYSME